MTEMRVKEIIDEVVSNTPEAGAIVEFGETHESDITITATRDGYLRLGAEFLRAAILPTDNSSGREHWVPHDTSYLFGAGSEVTIQSTWRREDLKRGIKSEMVFTPQKKKRDAIENLKFGIAALFVVLILLVPWIIGINCIFHR